MEGSSSTSRNTNGGMITFRNKYCECGKRAALKISEIEINPGKLFYTCESKWCKFFNWWKPDPTVFQTWQRTEEINRDSEEIKLLNAKMQKLETCFHGIKLNLESIQIGLRMMTLYNLIFFGVSSAVLFLIVLILVTVIERVMHAWF